MLTVFDCIIQWFIGYIFGILEAWNKKAWFFTLLIGMLLILIGSILAPPEFASNMTWWEFLIRIPLVIFGVECGKFNYNIVFKKK